MGAKQRLILSKLKRNKKGISSLYISIFIALLSIMLISTLYASQIISSSALSYQLQLDQEKNQESISLPGPKGFEFLDGDGTTVISLRV